MAMRYPIVGDIDKQFHRPECEQCEWWRKDHYAASDYDPHPIEPPTIIKDTPPL